METTTTAAAKYISSGGDETRQNGVNDIRVGGKGTTEPAHLSPGYTIGKVCFIISAYYIGLFAAFERVVLRTVRRWREQASGNGWTLGRHNCRMGGMTLILNFLICGYTGL